MIPSSFIFPSINGRIDFSSKSFGTTRPLHTMNGFPFTITTSPYSFSGLSSEYSSDVSGQLLVSSGSPIYISILSKSGGGF